MKKTNPPLLILLVLFLSSPCYAQKSTDTLSINLYKNNHLVKPDTIRDSVSRFYFNEQDTLQLEIKTASKKTVPITLNGFTLADVSDSTNCSFKIYTDLAGFSGNQPNGLAQSELSWKWDINLLRDITRRNAELNTMRYKKEDKIFSIKEKQSNLRIASMRLKQKQDSLKLLKPISSIADRKKDSLQLASDISALLKKTGSSYSYQKKMKKLKREKREVKIEYNEQIKDLPNYRSKSEVTIMKNCIFPILAVSKIDGKDRYKKLDYFNNPASSDTSMIPFIHTFDLVRYSNFSIAGKLNLLYINFPGSTFDMFIDMYTGLHSTGVEDSLSTQYSLFSKSYGASGKIRSHINQEFNIELGISYFVASLMNNEVRQKSGILYSPDANPKNKSTQPDSLDWTGKIPFNRKEIWSIQTQLIYTPDSKKPRNQYFLRFGYFTNAFFADKTLAVEGNNFFQVQLGFRKDFDLLNFGK